MRPVEKAAPALSDPVGGSVSYVDDVVLGDGGVSSDVVGRYVSVGDVSGGGDIVELCGVETVFSGVNSVVTAGELDVCGYDSIVSDEVGSSGFEAVVSVGDVVACDDDPLLPDAVPLVVVCRRLWTLGWWLYHEWLHLVYFIGRRVLSTRARVRHLDHSPRAPPKSFRGQWAFLNRTTTGCARLTSCR